MESKQVHRHIPVRTCIATGEKRPKNELVRIVRNPQNQSLEIDLKNKIRARGANLLPTLEAFDLMRKKRALMRALKLEKDLTNEEYEDLRNKFLSSLEEKAFRPDNKPVTIRVKKTEGSGIKAI